MRAIQVFVLRLLLDSDVPPALRGSIVSVSDSEPRTFTDSQGLLKALAELLRISSENQANGQAAVGQKQ